MREEMARVGAPVTRVASLIRIKLNVNSRVAYRHAHGLTQQQVAERWNELWPSDRPLTHKQVSYWESWPQQSGRPPSVEDLNRLARIYQCRTAELLDGHDYSAGSGQELARPVVGGGAGKAGLERPLRAEPADIVGRVDAFITESGAELVASDADYQRLVQQLIDWARRMQRRDILQWLSFAAAAAAASPVLAGLDDDERERTMMALAFPSRVDEQVLEHVEAVLWRAMRQDDALGPMAAMQTTLAQRSLVRSLIPAATGDVRDKLLSLYANLLRFAGWLSFDLNDYNTANQYFEDARTAAHEAHNTELGALVLCHMSHLATWRGQPRTGIDHALAAGGWATRTDDDHLKAYAHDVAARAYAMDRQQTAALGALSAARELISRSTGSTSGLVYFYNAGQLDSTESISYLYLGQPERAAQVAERALKGIDPAFVRNLAFTSTRLGVCHMRAAQPDIPQAALAIGAALRLSRRNRSARLAERLHRATGELFRWHDIAEVREVAEEMTYYGDLRSSNPAL